MPGIFQKVKNRFLWTSAPTGRQAGRVDFLVKMNLAPLMGRRDAALDRVEALMGGDLVGLSDFQQESVISAADRLLDAAVADTERIIVMLSSPDTEGREHLILSFLHRIRSQVEAMQHLYESRAQLFQTDLDKNELFLLPDDPDGVSRDDQIISDCQLLIVQRIREQFELGKPRILRYREYANKSFSSEYAERYAKARDQYAAFYLSHSVIPEEI